MTQPFPAAEETFLLSTETHQLEVLTTSPEHASETTPVAIICHPHPLHSGTMHNKVVTTLARSFKDLNCRTVRFNFRGVGKSTGTYDNGIGETEDLYSVIKWIQTLFQKAPICLAGFSFGAYIAAKVATQMSVKLLVCVAPPVVNFKMENFPEILCPWILVQGDQDDIVSPEAVFAWAEKRENKPTIIRIQDAGHFFHGKLLVFRESLFKELTNLA